MPFDKNRPAPGRCGDGTFPDHRREELLNRLCTLREDPRFSEWCLLTSALGLGDLPLGGLAALGADTAATLFPEASAAADGEGDRAADLVVGTGTLPGLPLSWRSELDLHFGTEPPVPFAALDDAAFDGRLAHFPADSGRAG